MKKAIIVLSFGTSYEETLEKNIIALEERVKEEFSDYLHFSAFTSPRVIKKLAERGIFKDNLEQTLEKIHNSSVTEVTILVTHLILGIEYESIENTVAQWQGKFEKLTVSKPLFSSQDDIRKISHILDHSVSVEKETAILLVGHGTSHDVNFIYEVIDILAKESGLEHFFVSTLENYPSVSTLIPKMRKNGYQKVHILPLLFVAGNHVHLDIISEDEESVSSILKKDGFSVTYEIKGLGEYPEIQDIYVNKCRELL